MGGLDLFQDRHIEPGSVTSRDRDYLLIGRFGNRSVLLSDSLGSGCKNFGVLCPICPGSSFFRCYPVYLGVTKGVTKFPLVSLYILLKVTEVTG